METLNKYWDAYSGEKYTYVPNSTASLGGYVCPYCGVWVNYFDSGNHFCGSWPIITPYYTYPPQNKTEQAFNILKALVKDGIVKEPGSFKKFCEIVEKIAKVV